MKTKNNESKRERWVRLMQDYERSGKHVAEWCAEVGCSKRSFEYWRYKVRIQETYDMPQPSGKRQPPEVKPEWIKAGCPAHAGTDAGAEAADPCVSNSNSSRTPDRSRAFGGVSIRIGAANVGVVPGFDRALLRDIVEALS
jgi:hypothetical protein